MTTGQLTIDSGTLVVRGRVHGLYGFGSSTTINGGVVTAYGGTSGIYGFITINGGTVTACGNSRAMLWAPNLTNYINPIVTASTHSDGSEPEAEYEPSKISTYKYLSFVKGPDITVSNLDLTSTLNAPSTGATPATTIDDTQYSGAVSWSGDPAKFLGNTTYTATVTLTAKTGYTFSGVGESTFIHTGATSVTNATGTGDTLTVTIVFPETAENYLSGIATISNTSPRIGDTLTGSLVGSNNTGTLIYTWKADGIQVSTEESYTVTSGDLGKSITLEIQSTTEIGTVTSTATSGVLKKIAPSTPVAPTLVSKTHNTVTLTANPAYEFSKDGITWQRSNVFGGLMENTAYTFYQRATETFDTEASLTSVRLDVKTNSNDSDDGGSDNNYDNSSDNKNPVGNNSLIIVTPPTPANPTFPTQGEIKVPGIVDNTGNATVNITTKIVTDVFDKALAEAKKSGKEQNGITLVLHVDAGSTPLSNVTVNLPKIVQDSIISHKIINTIVVVDNPDIKIGMDLATMKEINSQANADVNITAARTNNSKLVEDAKKAIGNRPVFDLKINYGSDKQVQNFGVGSVSVSIPYTLGTDEKAENIQAVYIDNSGKVHWLTDSVYDSVEKVLRFTTSHFSTYGVGYKQVESSTSIPAFAPNTEITRGAFVSILGKLVNADTSNFEGSNFIDVESNTYYMGYIEWAKQNRIVNGIGNRMFAPEQLITREQMAAIMQNYTKSIDFTLPRLYSENTFVDDTDISFYARDAVKQMQMAGILISKNENFFDPKGTTTYTETSEALNHLMNLIIPSDSKKSE